MKAVAFGTFVAAVAAGNGVRGAAEPSAIVSPVGMPQTPLSPVAYGMANSSTFLDNGRNLQRYHNNSGPTVGGEDSGNNSGSAGGSVVGAVIMLGALAATYAYCCLGWRPCPRPVVVVTGEPVVVHHVMPRSIYVRY